MNYEQSRMTCEGAVLRSLIAHQTCASTCVADGSHFLPFSALVDCLVNTVLDPGSCHSMNKSEGESQRLMWSLEPMKLLAEVAIKR